MEDILLMSRMVLNALYLGLCYHGMGEMVCDLAGGLSHQKNQTTTGPDWLSEGRQLRGRSFSAVPSQERVLWFANHSPPGGVDERRSSGTNTGHVGLAAVTSLLDQRK